MKPNFLSLVIGAGLGFIGYKLFGSAPQAVQAGMRRRLGGSPLYPYKSTWDSQNKAAAIMQSLAGVPVGFMSSMRDMPNSFYGGANALPSFGGDPRFMYAYDPDESRNFDWAFGFGPGGFGPPPPPA